MSINEELITISTHLKAIGKDLLRVVEILERAYPDYTITGSDSTNYQQVPGTTLPKHMPATYPEAGEHLTRPPSDDEIMFRDNKTCRRCGWYQESRNARSRNTRHLSVVMLADDTQGWQNNGKAGERVTLCPRCKRIVEGG